MMMHINEMYEIQLTDNDVCAINDCSSRLEQKINDEYVVVDSKRMSHDQMCRLCQKDKTFRIRNDWYSDDVYVLTEYQFDNAMKSTYFDVTIA